MTQPVALITGCSSGIGRALADAFLSAGYRVWATARKPEDLAALAAVETRAIEVPTVFRDFDDYWTPFLGGQGPAPGYAMSLDEGRRAALRERLRGALSAGPDGAIRLVARAWAVRGTKP